MAAIDFHLQEIGVKIVYCGPALSGKTTNVRKLHNFIPGKLVGELTTLDTEDERTLFFDYLPVQAGAIDRYRLKLQVFSVPGQAHYRATRRMVLTNVDGIVFVADSQSREVDADIAAFREMEEHLQAHGVDLAEVPLVFQYNKRDLPDILAVDALDRRLNPGGRPSVEAVAVQGKGVLEAFNQVVDLVTARLKARLGATPALGSIDRRVFQPVGASSSPSMRTVAELVARIGEVGEHSEVEVARAVEALGPVPVPAPPPRPEVAPRPLHFRLDRIEVRRGAYLLHLREGGPLGGAVSVELDAAEMARLSPPTPVPAPAPPAEEASAPLILQLLMFTWLAVLTVLYLMGG